MTRRLAVPALAACVLLAACPPAGPNTPIVRLRTTITPAESVAAGDSLHLVTWLTNPTDEALRMEFTSHCQVELYVAAPDKTILYPPGGGSTCIRTPTVLEVAAGDSVRFDGTWLAMQPDSGEYAAYAVLSDHHIARGGKRDLKLGHRSNVAVFHVTPAPAATP